MKRSALIFYALCIFFIFTNALHAEEVTIDNIKLKVFFSLDGGCTNAIIEEINNAKSEILVQAYSFTSKEIAKALEGAFKRHVNVEVILDKGQRTEKKSVASYLAKKGIPVYIDAKHSTAHNKLMIIDESTVITGSLNYFKAAEKKNAENMLIIPSKELTDLYVTNWEKHKAHSETYR